MSYEWVSVNSHIRFPGQWEDEESGLYYNWHRYYDPTTGRYLQPDPLAAPAVSNLYGYARNNPMAFIDPTGLWVPYFDPNGSRIMVKKEGNESLASLYTQLGLSADEFGQYKVNESIYDITSLLINDSGIFRDLELRYNCCGFIARLMGKIDETQMDCDNFLTVMELSEADRISGSPILGDIALWTISGWNIIPSFTTITEDDGTIYYYDGVYEYHNNTPAHAAMFLMKNEAGENFYLQAYYSAGLVIGTANDVRRDYYNSMRERNNPIPGPTKTPASNKNINLYRRGGL